MSLSLTVNGVAFSYPVSRDRNWAANASGWAAAVTSGMLQKAGGTFILTADVDFGPNFGLKSAYFSGRTSPASTGLIRLGNTEAVKWRNAADSGDLSLAVDGSDHLIFEGTRVQSALSVSDTSTIDLTLSGSSLSAAIIAGSVSNTHVASGAAIARSKIATGTANRLVVNDSGGALSDNAELTASRALASDSSGLPVASATTATELGYVNGVTSAIQTQLANRLNLSGGTMTGALVLYGTPQTATEAATKQYVDDTLNGVANRKASVRAATTTNVNLANAVENGDTLDGITLATNDRILVKDQSTASQNGIYVVAASGTPTRATDADTWAEVVAAFVFVTSGTANAGTGWATNVSSGGTIGVTSMTWVQTAGAAAYSADGQGIELSSTTFSLELDGGTLSKSASGLKVASSGIADAQISSSAAIARSKIATGTANRLLYNAAVTGALSDLSALTASRLLKSDSNGLPAVLSAITANRALASDSSGFPVHSAVTDTELGYVSGVTSAIQTQLNNKLSLSGGTLTGTLFATAISMNGDIDCGDITADTIACTSLTINGETPLTTSVSVYENVVTAEVTGAAASSIDITSIPAFDYYDMLVDLKMDNASGTEQIRVRFNADGAGNYAQDISSGLDGIYLVGRSTVSPIAIANTFYCVGRCFIRNTATQRKSMRGDLELIPHSGIVGSISFGSGSTDYYTLPITAGGLWNNTASQISRITLASTTSAKFQIGSKVKIIGLNF